MSGAPVGERSRDAFDGDGQRAVIEAALLQRRPCLVAELVDGHSLGEVGFGAGELDDELVAVEPHLVVFFVSPMAGPLPAQECSSARSASRLRRSSPSIGVSSAYCGCSTTSIAGTDGSRNPSRAASLNRNFRKWTE